MKDSQRSSFNSVIATIILLAAWLVMPQTTVAQFYSGSQMTFGKNRVQNNDERTWSYFRFKGFDTYFYADGKALAIYCSSYADKEIKRISTYLDFNLDDKIKFMIFNDLSDLKETNIGLLTDEEYNIGGETHIVDNKVFIFFNGNHRDYELQISKGIGNIFLNQILYGGSIGSTVKNSILLSFPEWFTDGFVSFISEDWSTVLDNKVRDGFLSGRFNNFKRLSHEEQVVAGHSIWKYINDKYGRRALSDVLFMAKINRSIESGFIYVLGVSYDGLLNDWKDWYTGRYIAEKSLGFNIPDNPFFKRVSRKKKYSSPRLSADGKYLAYAENQIGRVKIKIINTTTGRSKTIEKYGYKLNEKVDYSYPIMAWSPTGHFLTYVIEEKGNNVLKFYDMDERKRKKRYLNNFDKILSISYNNRGNLIVMSAVQKGQSDIFIYNVGANTYKRITYDIYDDEQPIFVNGGTAIIFASNRRDDTLRHDIETGKNITRDTLRGMANRDIFYYDLKKKKPLLKRVTDTKDADETQPQYIGYNKFAWLSNETGIYNRKIGKFDSTISFIDTIVHYNHIAKSYQVTNYVNNIKEQHLSATAGKFVEIVPVNGRDMFFIKDLPEFEDFEIQKPIYTTYVLGEKYKHRKKPVVKPVEKKIQSKDSIQPVEKTTDSIPEPKKTQEKKKFKVIYIGQNDDNSSNIDFDNYDLAGGGGTKSKNKNTSDNYVEKPVKKPTSEQLYRTLNYDVQFSINQIITQMDFSYMNLSYQPYSNLGIPIFNNQGFSAFMKFGVMDLLEDYRIVGGIKLSPNFRDNEYMLNFTNLKKRLDKEYTFHRMVLNTYHESGILKDYVHEVFFKYSWPFDNVRSIRTTVNLRNDTRVSKSVNHLTLVEPNVITNRVGLKVEYVYDNTRNPALNIHYGTRYKLFAEYYQPVENLNENTYIVGLDFRKYIKLARNFIWANRLAASSSFGTQRLIYFMGGVDNWMFPNFNRNIQVDQDQKYVYQTIATNMRGFDQNIRNGNNFIAINSELRLPPFAVLSSKPIKSDFLANFMIVGFFDVGTAWTGPNPFSDKNSLFQQEFYQKPIKVIVINQNDPIVAGYGFGLRSKLFGYYVRADWAWGIQNGYFQKAMFYLSLSLDF